jgi:hypothetical protein
MRDPGPASELLYRRLCEPGIVLTTTLIALAQLRADGLPIQPSMASCATASIGRSGVT